MPSEKLDKHISDYETIETPEGDYKIVQWVTIIRGEKIPSSLIILATGQDVSGAEIFTKYRKSNRLIFFICEKISCNTK